MATESTREFYSISDPEAQQTYVGVRRAAKWVGFFMPHLRPGFSVLDCGCGVGSITLDLAEQVAPGQVVGIDVDEGQLAVARQRAVERGLANVSFQPGNVYALTFEDGTFDAVLAHTLLMHLSACAKITWNFEQPIFSTKLILNSTRSLWDKSYSSNLARRHVF